MPRVILTLLCLLVLCASSAPAQERPGGCGSDLRPEDLAAFQASERLRLDQPFASKAGTWYFVPIQFHIVRKSNGNAGLDPDDLGPILDTLNADFAEMQMVFYNAAPVQYIDDDHFYEEINSDLEVDDLRGVNNVDTWLDIYFVKEFSDDDGPLCGKSSFAGIGRTQGIVMDQDCTVNQGDPSTMTHEVGHYLDLLHTHETALGVECVDGSNCTWAGDLVCDTPADPELGGHNVVDCVYIGAELDSCDNSPYSPREHNFMSYTPTECATRFTNGQVARAISALLSLRADHITIASTSSSAVYVDWRNGGTELGSSLSPYDTLEEGILWAQIQGRRNVIVAGGNYPASVTAVGMLVNVTIAPSAGKTATFAQ